MARSILHMLTPLKHMSPFDVNMAIDAGFETLIPYTGVDLTDVVSLTQDSIFSRAPQDGVRTGIFIGGKNAELALDMVDRAKKAFVPPSSTTSSPTRPAPSPPARRWSPR